MVGVRWSQFCVLANRRHVSRLRVPAQAELKHKVDLYLRNMFAFGPDVKLVVGDFKETGMPGLLETNINRDYWRKQGRRQDVGQQRRQVSDARRVE